MKDLIVRILFKADDKAVKSQLKKTEQEAKKAANNIGGSLKKAFGGLAASIAGVGLGRVFKSAIDDAAKLEQSLLKLQAAAKNTGQDFGTIEKGLQRLRSEGTLSFQTITEASQQLLQQGFQADQIEPFLRALRNIGALENTVGDTNLAIQSFIRAISTNSIELVDNLSPALRKTVLELGGFNAIAKDANKQQKFLNITLDRGAQFADAYQDSVNTVAGTQAQFAVETEKLSESFGKVLIPAFQVFLDIGSDIVVGLTNAINGFSSLERALLAASSAATALGLSLAVIAGPYVALGAAATAFLTVLIASRQELNEVNDLVDDTADQVKKLEKKLIDLDNVQSSDSQKALLIEELKTATNNYNDALIRRIELERNVNLSTIEALKTEKQRIAFQRTQALNILQLGSSVGFTKEQQRILSRGSVAQVETLTGEIKAGQVKGFRGGFTVEQLAALKTLPLLAQETTAVNTALNAATLASKKYSQALNDSSKKKKQNTDQTQDNTNDIDKETQKKIKLTAELEKAASNVDNMTSSVEVLKDESASASDKVRGLGKGLRGLGSIIAQLGLEGNKTGLFSFGKELGVAGAGLGLIGAIGGFFDSLFTSNEETNDTLEQQLKLQELQYSLQKEQYDNEKRFFEEDLELIRLRAKKEGRDPTNELADAIKERLRELGFTGELSIEDLEIQKIRAEQEVRTATETRNLLERLDNLKNITKLAPFAEELSALKRAAGLGALTGQELFGDPGGLANRIRAVLTERLQETGKGTQQDIFDLIQQGIEIGITAPPPTTLQQVQPRGFSFLDVSRGGLQTALGFAPSRAVEMISGAGVPGQIGSLTVATEAMKTTEEKMLDTLDGQLSELKKQTDILSRLTGQDVTIAVLNAISAGQARSL